MTPATGGREDLSCLQKSGQGSHTSFVCKFKRDNCLHLFKQSRSPSNSSIMYLLKNKNAIRITHIENLGEKRQKTLKKKVSFCSSSDTFGKLEGQLAPAQVFGKTSSTWKSQWSCLNFILLIYLRIK